MSENQLTFEEVNSHVEKNFTQEHQAAFAAIGTDLCSIYKVVKPILTLITQVVLIPQTWRAAVKVLISALDALCPAD